METTSERFNAAVGAQMRAEIAAHGYNVKSAAEAMGIARGVLIRYLEGQRNIPISVAARLADLLEMPLSTLIQRAEDRAATKTDD
ncbi:helix-turn-helix domain-containing protein [Pseudactinotalea sp. Z1732]|uniref:helix-turn-helix domain-containing protein n=1 Tax=Micrococcales TaxID=85006 RepID=UPI003C7B0DC1